MRSLLDSKMYAIAQIKKKTIYALGIMHITYIVLQVLVHSNVNAAETACRRK